MKRPRERRLRGYALGLRLGPGLKAELLETVPVLLGHQSVLPRVSREVGHSPTVLFRKAAWHSERDTSANSREFQEWS